MFPMIQHPVAGRHPVTGTPVKLSSTPGQPGMPAPLLGEHTKIALRELLDLDSETLESLEERGVVYAADLKASSR
jgi:crotonobetainyl-CoA:carnitine CoA-transferase CaiB-like acyl-CoA transferase